MSCQLHPHIQSFFIVTELRGLDIIKKIWRCRDMSELDDKKRQNWIDDTEVKLGKTTHDLGYEMRSLLAIYDGIGSLDDYMKKKCHRGINPTTVYPFTDDDLKDTILKDAQVAQTEWQMRYTCSSQYINK